MTDYTRQIEQIKAAQSLDEIQAIARSFPAQAQGEGGILYTGKVGSVDAMVIAKELAHKTGLPIINDTPRAQFLSDGNVGIAIRKSAERILTEQGMPPDQVGKAAPDFLYGNGKAAPESPLSVKNSLWGEASAEFAGSVRGHVVVVASAANAERVLAQVEVPTVLNANQAASLGGHALPQLRDLHAQGGMQAVLPEVQASFIDASTKGIFIDPSMVGKQVTQVAVSREVATTLNLDGSKFVGAAALSDAGFVPAPIVPAAPAVTMATAVPHVSEPTLAPEEAAVRSGLSPNAARAVTGVAAAGLAIDGTQTIGRTADLLHQGNRTGAASQVEHFGARNLGAWGGAALGAEIFGTAGAETGPADLLIGGAGAVVGAVAGDKLADAYDQHKIYNQSDARGQSWHYDPKQPQQSWTRTAVDTFAERGMSSTHVETAPPAVAERLNYQANNTAVDLALAHPTTPRDPYTQPAGPKDTPSQVDAPWTRDAQTQQWSRTVTDQVMEHGLTSTHGEVANPQRTAELNASAQQTIAENLANSPRGIAEHYQAVYEQRGWQQQGPMPEAVTSALKAPANTLEASNGHTYTRGADGQWATPGMLYGTNAAEGNVRHELDATQAARTATEPARHTPEPTAAAVHTGPSRTMDELWAKFDRFDQAMAKGDRAAMANEVAHVYETPGWKADYARAQATVAGETQQQAQHRAQNPRDPRDATHPDHALNQDIRKQVETLHERAGIFISNKTLDHLTASVALSAREQRLTQVDQLHFNADKTAVLAEQKSNGYDVMSKVSTTNVQQAMQTPPEHAYQQMAGETQRQAQTQQAIQQQIAAQAQQGPSQGQGR